MNTEFTPSSIATDILNGGEDRITEFLKRTMKVDDPIEHLRRRAKNLAKSKGGWFAEDEEAVVHWLITKNIKEGVPGTQEFQLKQNRDGVSTSNQIRARNDLKRNLWVEKRDDNREEDLMTCYEFLQQYHPELINSIFCNWLDQWASNYWNKHMSRKQLKTECGDGDWDFGSKIYPKFVLELLSEYKIQYS